MRTFDEDDFDSRTTLPRADKRLILELSDEDFRRGYVGPVPQRHMPRMPPEIPGYVKSRRVWPIFLFITLAAASAGLVLGAGGSDWRANAVTKFAGSVTVTEQSLARPKKEEPSASAPTPEPASTVKHMIAEAPPPAPVPAPKPYVPVAPKSVVKPAPKPVVAPAAASVEPASASDDEIVSPPPKASAEPAPPQEEAETPKAAAPKPAASSGDQPED